MRSTTYYKGQRLSPWPLLLAEEKGIEGHVGHLDNLEPDAGNITDGVAFTSETSDQDLVVLLHEVQAAVLGDEGRDLLAVLDELNTHALPDGRVGLFGLNTDLLIRSNINIRKRNIPFSAKHTILLLSYA